MTPQPREILERLLSEWQSELHTSFPAVVLSYDAEAQTVEVRPCIQREVPDDSGLWTYETLPDLVNVPVMWPRGGGFAITWPISAGDGVLIVCAESATGIWRDEGMVPSEPAWIDPHGLNGCVALPGWVADGKRLRGVSTSDLVIGASDGTTTIKVKADGTVTLGSDVAAVPLALAPSIQSAMSALAAAVMEAANALPPPSDPASTGAKAGATAIASAINAWAGGVNVAATKVKGV